LCLSAAGAARRPAQPTRSNGRSRRPPAGTRIHALLDAQELDSRASTGAVYWEGLSDLLDENGARVGRGYLEMTGYAGNLRI